MIKSILLTANQVNKMFVLLNKDAFKIEGV